MNVEKNSCWDNKIQTKRVLVIFSILFLYFFISHLSLCFSGQKNQGVLLEGWVLSVNIGGRYINMRNKITGETCKIYINDPIRLREIKINSSIKVFAEKDLKKSAYIARKIWVSKARYLHDPTGVRARMRRAMKGSGINCRKPCQKR